MDWRLREDPRVVFHVLRLMELDRSLGRACELMLERKHAGFVEQCGLLGLEEQEVGMLPVKEQSTERPVGLSVPMGFPSEILDELCRGRLYLKQIAEREATVVRERERLLRITAICDLDALWAYAKPLNSVTFSSTEMNYQIGLPGFPYIRVRYGWTGSEWVRVPFDERHPELVWAVMPYSTCRESEWILAVDRAEALARAERLVTPVLE